MSTEKPLKPGGRSLAFIDEGEANGWAASSSANGDRQQVAEVRSGGQDFRSQPEPGEKRVARWLGVQEFFLSEMREDIVEHDEPAADFPCALSPTILGILLADYAVEGFGTKLIERTAGPTWKLPDVSAPFCLAEEMCGDVAPFPLNEKSELATEEVPGIDGNGVQEGGLSLGVPEVPDGVDRVVLWSRGAHISSTQSSVCCSSSIFADKEVLSEEEAYMRKPAWAFDWRCLGR
jgi:hypothetical protein